MSDDEASGNELIGNGTDEEDANDSNDDEVPEPEPDEEQFIFLPYNKGFHKVPILPKNPPPDVAGCVRCYFRKLVVPTGIELGNMISGVDAWPRGEALGVEIDAAKIVVINGKIGKDDSKLSSIWYLLIEAADSTGKQDHLIARHIPRAIYREIIESIKKNPEMTESRLLREQAANDNLKPLSPGYSGFEKAKPHEVPQSAAVFPDKKPAKTAAQSEGSTDKAPPKKAAPKASDKANDKASDKAKGAETVATEKPKPSVASLWKPRAVEAASEKAPSAAPAAAAAAAPTASAAAPAAAPSASAGKKRPMSNGGPSESKKTRTSVRESWEVLVTEPEGKIDFSAPSGATSAEVSITWSFA